MLLALYSLGRGEICMHRAMWADMYRHRLLIFLAAAILALLIAAPAAYAAYTNDWGMISCGPGKMPGLVVRAKGFVHVRAVNESSEPTIYRDYHTGGIPITRRFHQTGPFADHFMSWRVDVSRGGYVSRMGTHGYCYRV